MKCLVIGAGAQGAAAASILARASDVESFILADYDVARAEAVRAHIVADTGAAGGGKIRTVRLDAGDVDAVARLASDVDVILNFVHMDFSAGIRAAALKAAVHYVDTASDLSWQHDLAFEGRSNGDDAFKAAGLTGLSGSGDTPGVCNAMARYGADMLDEIDALIIRCGYVAPDAGAVVHPFDPGWSPEVALQDYNDKACVFTGGVPTLQGPFANPEVYPFPEPVGDVLICSHSHDESYTLPRYIGKGIKECDFKYNVDPGAGTLVAMGFGDPTRVLELRDGTKVRPFEVAMALTPRPGEAFLDTPDLDAGGGWNAWMVIDIQGRSGGRPKHVVVRRRYSDDPATARHLVETLGTFNVGVAAAAFAGARMIMAGKTPAGVMPVEALDPLAYLAEVQTIMPLEIEVEVREPLAL
jgi:saccharopine dehydrogenase-like NADP-dependent oxidoreductase